MTGPTSNCKETARSTFRTSGDERGLSTAVVTGDSGGYQAFPVPPRMVFVTLQAAF